jgi:hypothetical protein
MRAEKERSNSEGVTEEPGQSASGSQDTVELHIRPLRLVLIPVVACFVVELLFLPLDYHINLKDLFDKGSLQRLFNLERGDSLPSWFATAQAMLTAMTLWLIYCAVKSRGASRHHRAAWLLLALIFSWMTLDTGVDLRENLGDPTTELLQDLLSKSEGTHWIEEISDSLRDSSWRLALVPVYMAVGIFMVVFLSRALKARYSKTLLGIALALYAGAIGLDICEGLYDNDYESTPYDSLAERYEFEEWAGAFKLMEADILIHFSVGLEATMRMLANTLMWLLFLNHFVAVAGDLQIRFVEGRATDERVAEIK